MRSTILGLDLGPWEGRLGERRGERGGRRGGERR